MIYYHMYMEYYSSHVTYAAGPTGTRVDLGFIYEAQGGFPL